LLIETSAPTNSCSTSTRPRRTSSLGQHGNVHGKLKGKRRFVGEGPSGKIHEQQIVLTYGDEVRTFRRITIELLAPTRDGDSVMHLLTNLPADPVAGAVAADCYRRRWTIETLLSDGNAGV
jgi:hypothetical protein